MQLYEGSVAIPTQDTVAELSEVFLVRLSSVTLDSDENGDILPSIGTNSQAQVTILPNDNPEGILTFLQSRYSSTTTPVHLYCVCNTYMTLYIYSIYTYHTCLQCSVNVTEDVGDVVLTVRRDQGRVGRVSAVVLITELGAADDQDFTGTNLEARVYACSTQLGEGLTPILYTVFCIQTLHSYQCILLCLFMLIWCVV